MRITRRDYLKASSITAVALTLEATGIKGLEEAKAAALTRPPVLWLQAQSCSGCSVSLLNTIYYTTIDKLLINTLDMKYHPTLMAAADDMAIASANQAYTKGGYILVVEGAIPTGASGKYCYLWPGLTAMAGVKQFASRAAYILAVGTCAAYGGVAAAAPNVTAAKSVQAVVGTGYKVINVPGCPTHPDWVVGTVSYILTNGKAPALTTGNRPSQYYGRTTHSRCPFEDDWDEHRISRLSSQGCLYGVGCKGQVTGCDCPSRKWNGAAAATTGVNWCIGAGGPCHGCTEATFPDGMSPFFNINGAQTGWRGGGDD